MREKMYFKTGKNVGIRPIMREDINLTYINWLNDEKVNRYSGRIKYPSNEKDIENYIGSLKRDEYILAVCILKNDKHIGNIKYGPIDWYNRNCEIEILIGEKDEWGKGYGSEAIYIVTKHLIRNLNMNRVEAKSANPAFYHAVLDKLGWTHEGEMRKRFFMDGQFIGYRIMSILQDEFETLDEYEKNRRCKNKSIGT